jgi:type IV pilus assembly protein PilV
MHMKSTVSLHRHGSRGFSLVEVMVALIVCAVGLLGLAKMESLSLSSTGIAGSRALAALQASSMASMMHANRDYWGTPLVLTTPTITVSAANNYSTVMDCTLAAPCTPPNMALADLKSWATSLNSVLPGYVATITCANTATPTVNSCAIQIQWIENAVAMDSTQGATANMTALRASSTLSPSYTVYVEP